MSGLVSLGGVGSTLNTIARTDKKVSKLMEKLSTGKKVNGGADSAVALQTIKKLASDIDGLEIANNNMARSDSMLEVANGAQNQIMSGLQELSSLAVQAADGSLSGAERDAVAGRTNSLMAEINRISQGSHFVDSSLSGIENAMTETLENISDTASIQNQFSFAEEANQSQILSKSSAKSDLEDLDIAKASTESNKLSVARKAGIVLLGKSLGREKKDSEVLSLKL